MKIYNYLGVELLDIEVDDKSYRYKELMSDNQLFLYFSLPYHIELPIGAYVDFKAERYFISDPENFKMNHTRDWEYTVVLDSYISLTKSTKFKFFTLVGGLAEGDFELKFSLTETAAEFVALFVQNMNNADPDGGWEVGDCIESEPILLDFNHTFCYDVLSELADKFKTEWEIEGKTLHLRKVEKLKESPTPLTYGYDCGLIPGFQRSNASKKKANRLYVQTSERNIDSDTYGRKTLSMLKSATVVHNGINYVTDASGSYIERQGRTGLILENSADLTHIYPKRIGTVSNVISVDAEKHLYDIVDLGIENELNFNDYLIAGETMTLIFQTGDLAGLEFDVKYIHADRRFELVPISETGVTYPTDALLPSIDDKYAVFHCSLPGSYLTSAETDATNEAAAELYEQEQDKYTYNGILDELYAKRHWLEIGGFLNVGYFVSLTLQDAITVPVDIRIVAVKEYVNKPQQPEITLSNEASGKQLGSALASVKNKEQAVTRINNNTIRFARRQFADVKQTTEMLQNSLLNFSGAISPISVQAMQYIAGDESLQFEFVANSNSIVGIPHTEDYDPATKKFTSAAGVLQHKTLGVTTLSSSHAASEFKWWTMAAYLSPVLDESSKSYYLYAKVSKTANTGIFLLSETAIVLEGVAGYYHLLMGILNSENNGDRSYSQMYGYSELNPARLTTKKIVSPSGNMFIDLENEIIQGNMKFQSPGGGYKEVGAGISEAVDAVQIGGRNLLQNSSYVPFNSNDTGMGTSVLMEDETDKYYRATPASDKKVSLFGGWFALESEKQYIESVEVRQNSGSDVEIVIYNHINSEISALTHTLRSGIWMQIACKPFIPTTIGDSAIILSVVSFNTPLDYKKIQVENGTKATAWSPAPEDVEAAYKAYAVAQKELAEITAAAYADGIVSDEETRAIADATTKAANAKAEAISIASEDATAKAAEALRLANENAAAEVATINTKFATLQSQVDGEVNNWFYPQTPDLVSYPVTEWDTNEKKDAHVGDTFTNTQQFVDNTSTPNAGKSWRFLKDAGVYSWSLIADSDAVLALQKASQAQGTADGKSTTYLAQPTTYKSGDFWVLAADWNGFKAGEMLNASQNSASFVSEHWSKKNKYTDDTAVENLVIGGRNLILNSSILIHSIDYNIAFYALSEELVVGEQYVLTAYGEVNSGGTLGLWRDHGYRMAGEADAVNGKFTIKFTCPNTDDPDYSKIISLYNREPAPYDATITKIKLEKGNNATDWTAAPEDVAAYAEAVAELKRIEAEANSDGKIDEAEARAIAAAEFKVSSLEIGGRNLVLNSKFNEESNAYGFAIRDVFLVGGKTYTFTANGNAANALNNHFLRVYLYAQDWSFAKIHEITSLEDSSKATTFVAPFTGSYGINSYYFDGSEPRTGSVKSNWYKVEAGSKSTDWTPAPEDIDASILVVSQAAANANAELTAITSDGVFDKAEKISKRQEWEIIASEKTALNTQATSFGVSVTAYNAAFTVLANYLNAGATWVSPQIPFWISDSQLSVNTTIPSATTFRANYKSYYDAKIALMNAISAKAKQLADTAQSAANNAQYSADDAYSYASDAYSEASSANSAIANMVVGGENLITNSSFELAALAVDIYKYKVLRGSDSGVAVIPSPYLVNGKTYVFTAEKVEKLAGGATGVSVILYDCTTNQGTANFNQVLSISTSKQTRVFTVPDTGYWSLIIYAGVAGSTANNTIKFTNLMCQEGNRATTFKPATEYLTEALAIDDYKPQGQDIGLLWSKVLLMRDSQGIQRGGMSGLASDNIFLFGGGTYEQALADLAKIILRKDGSGQLASGSLWWDVLGQLFFGKSDAAETIKISTGTIPTLAEINNRELYTLPVFNQQIIKDLNNPAHAGINLNTTYQQEFTLENDGWITLDTAVGYSVGTDVIGFGIDGQLVLEKHNGTAWVLVQSGTMEENAIYLSFYQQAATKGRYRVSWAVECGWSSWEGYNATITLDKYCSIEYKLLVKKLVIGIDGLALFDSGTDKYLRLSLNDSVAQLRLKLNIDIPAGLGGASITSLGNASNKWGLGTTLSTRSTTTTTIKHNVTDTKFTVNVTPKNSFTWYLSSITAASSPTANDGNIVIVCSINTAIFDFVIVRTPY